MLERKIMDVGMVEGYFHINKSTVNTAVSQWLIPQINESKENGSSLKVLEFQNLIDKFDLLKDEDYDCSKLNVWSFRKKEDVRNGINIKFGNMVNGFPFTVAGVRFSNSEMAYIAGAFATDDAEIISIQRKVASCSNGLKGKRTFRNSPYSEHAREDFYTYNVQWMMYVVWQKCIQCKEFAELLRQIPIDAVVVENSSFHRGETSTFWGAKNQELKVAGKIAEAAVRKESFRFKKNYQQAQMMARMDLSGLGHFVGKNVMGKIIKMCSLCLIYDQEPNIDYDLLRSKKLSWFGQPLDFHRNQYD